MSKPYSWIIAQPVTTRARPKRNGRGHPGGYTEAPRRVAHRKDWVDHPCCRCGYDPLGTRKHCPACLTPVERREVP